MTAGSGLSALVSGTTGVYLLSGVPYTGNGAVYGIYFKSGNVSFGLVPHTSGGQQPGTGLYYPAPLPFGSGVQLFFKINVLSGNGILLTGEAPALTGLNSEWYAGTAYAGPSGFLRPSGYLLHKESYKLLPNYGRATKDVYTGDPTYSIYRGGVYPEMLQDNSISINLQITWSGESGDAQNC